MAGELPSDGGANESCEARARGIDLDDVIDREGPEVPETVSGGDWRVLFVEELLRCVEHMEGSVAGGVTAGADGVNVGEDYFVGVSSEGGVEDVHDHGNQVWLVVQDSWLSGGVGGVEGLLIGAISLTLELAGRLGDGLVSGAASFLHILANDLSDDVGMEEVGVVLVHDIDEGVDCLVENIEFGVEGGGGGLAGSSSRNGHDGIISEREPIVNSFPSVKVIQFVTR